MSLNSEGNEFQSLAAAYLNVDCPMADLTVGRSSNVLSLKFLWWTFNLNLNVLNWTIHIVY